MTPFDGDGRALRRGGSPDPRVGPVAPHQVVRGICPYLGTGEGWRLAVPDRAHRCLAVSPATPLALSKQARLCLVDAHRDCATFRAAVDVIGGNDSQGSYRRGEPFRAADRRRWPVPRTQPTVLDVGRGSVDVGTVARERATTQVALVLLALVAFGALLLARVGGSTPGVAGAVASPSLAGVESSARPSGNTATTPLPTAVGTDSTATEAPAASPPVGPSAALRRYTVRAGDTLLRIAHRYGTTVRALQTANAITNPANLRIGQVLVIP